jgi:flagellar hook-associated protein 3 FlgL
MSIDRIATAQQSQYFLSQIEAASSALNTTQQQIASGDNATTYAGFGTQTQVLQATMSANARNTAYQTATTLAVTQADLQDTQLTSLSSLASQLNTAVSTAISTNDPSTLMTQVQSIFSQAVSLLNSQDANGAYIYGGGNDSTPPVSVTSLSQLASLPSASDAFTNGNDLQSVQVADGQSITYGVTASSVGQGLMQELQNIAQFDQGSTGDFDNSTTVSSAQNTFLTGEMTSTSTVADNLNNATAQNGDNYSALTNAQTQQSTMATLYSGFISNIQQTNMAQAATQLSLDQTQLQAALQVTATLNQLSLLNYLPVASTSG